MGWSCLSCPKLLKQILPNYLVLWGKVSGSSFESWPSFLYTTWCTTSRWWPQKQTESNSFSRAHVLMQWILSPDVPDAKCLQGHKKFLNKFKEEKPLGGHKIQKYHLWLRLIFCWLESFTFIIICLACSSTLLLQTSLTFVGLHLVSLSMRILMHSSYVAVLLFNGKCYYFSAGNIFL